MCSETRSETRTVNNSSTKAGHVEIREDIVRTTYISTHRESVDVKDKELLR